jgi:iron complex transport system ATP-binding protein
MHLKINDVDFSYSSTPVLEGISLELDGPQLVSILGPNGVGKSTLIHCINKILKPVKGFVALDGNDVNEMTLKELAKKMGYVPYSANDTFPFTVVDTVLMGRYPHSKWKSLEKDLDIAYEMLKLLGIEHLAMRPFNELSAGQHQKVVLARGLVQEPRVLLLDEPTSNLDIRHQLEVTKMLRNLAVERGMLIIMISHDINIAAKFSDKVILMHKGTIYSVGTPREVITSENLEAIYGVVSTIIIDDGKPHIILKDAIPPCEEPSSAEETIIMDEEVAKKSGGADNEYVRPFSKAPTIRTVPSTTGKVHIAFPCDPNGRGQAQSVALAPEVHEIVTSRFSRFLIRRRREESCHESGEPVKVDAEYLSTRL